MRLVSIDFETHRFQRGILAPPPVCLAVASDKGRTLVVGDDQRKLLRQLLEDPTTLLVGANIQYDAVVSAAQWSELLPLWFAKYEQGHVFDVLLAQALDAIAKGCFCKDPRTGQGMRMPPGPDGKPKRATDRYSLELVTYQVLGRADAKVNDTHKLRYHELEGVPLERWPAEAKTYPLDDVSNALEAAYKQRSGGWENLQEMPRQAEAGFALQLSSVYGWRTDPVAVAALKDSLTARLQKAIEDFRETGLITSEGKENGPLKKRLVAIAYGAKDPCPYCQGTGKAVSQKSGNEIQCKRCSATGLLFAPGTPRGDPTQDNPEGGICADRDVLSESGDEALEGYAKVSEIRKGLDTYVPWLEEGTDRPLLVEPNVIGAETLRTSYSGLIQLIPRKGGFRETFIPRKGRVLCSVDYTAAELSGLAEVLLEVIGWSNMANAINADKDLHVLFASEGLLGKPYAETLATYKADKTHPVISPARQNSKEANFGFGGMMGGATFAGSVRKKGIRLCINAHRAPKCPACPAPGVKTCRRCYGRGFLCGVKKVTIWGKNQRVIKPTCEECILVAEDLQKRWLTQWPEMREYFTWVTGQKDGNGVIRMRAPITGVIRGDMLASQAANYPFQHIVSIGSKEALRLINRECFLDKKSPLYGSRILAFAHDETLMDHAEDRAHEAAHRQAELMCEGMRKVIKRVKVKAEPALMRRWYKDAEPVYVNGRLVPWEPKAA